jgi:hypothetical protein
LGGFSVSELELSKEALSYYSRSINSVTNKKSKAKAEAKAKPPRWAKNKQVCEYMGGITIMTLTRYRQRYEDFPRPIKLERVLLTDLNKIDKWLLDRARAGLGR